MASVSTADFRNGMCIVNNGKMCTIVEFQHVKPGKGGAFVRTKLRDIKTGRVVDYTFNSGTKFDSVRLETKKMQYLYNDGADYYFMDNDTYEQMSIPVDTVGEAAKWLKENDEATLLYAGDELISIEPQMFVELEVTHTEPGFKGDTATNTTKPATLETGVELQVPTFIEIGDVLQIDTELEVTHTEPGFKGDTATNTTKPATLETGVELQVPTFIEIGDVLQIDTRDGRFIKRV